MGVRKKCIFFILWVRIRGGGGGMCAHKVQEGPIAAVERIKVSALLEASINKVNF